MTGQHRTALHGDTPAEKCVILSAEIIEPTQQILDRIICPGTRHKIPMADIVLARQERHAMLPFC
jgi:hypothetical protein